MAELCINIRMPGMTDKRYRFGETPVLVGRSVECHLSICHEAIPRKLCKVWLEGEGRVVRVETCPGLTNPFLRDGRVVKDGVSGSHLIFNVGPIEIEFFTEYQAQKGVERPEKSSAKKRAVKLALIPFALGLILSASLLFQRENTRAPKVALPDSPFSNQTNIPQKGDATELISKAKMMKSRAAEILSRRAESIELKVLAFKLMQRAHYLFKSVGNDKEAREVEERLNALRQQLEAAYRKDILRLHSFLASDDTREAAKCAKRLLIYLDDEFARSQNALRSIIARNRGGS